MLAHSICFVTGTVLAQHTGIAVEEQQAVIQGADDAVAVLRGLLQYAEQTDQLFSNGAFMLHDPDNLLFDHLKGHLDFQVRASLCHICNPHFPFIHLPLLDFSSHSFSSPLRCFSHHSCFLRVFISIIFSLCHTHTFGGTLTIVLFCTCDWLDCFIHIGCSV